MLDDKFIKLFKRQFIHGATYHDVVSGKFYASELLPSSRWAHLMLNGIFY